MAAASKRSAQTLVFVLGLFIVVLPLCSSLLPQTSREQLTDVYSKLPSGTLMAIGGCLVVAIAICLRLVVRMRSAAIPAIYSILFVSGYVAVVVSANAARNVSQQQPKNSGQSMPTRLAIGGGFPGIQVSCNGVDLGVTPISMAISEFQSMVPLAEFPPDQRGVSIDRDPTGGFRYAYAGWSQIPSELSGKEVLGFGASSSPRNIIMKRLASIGYWWSFRSEGRVARQSQLEWSQQNDALILTSKLQWAESKEHARLLDLLAREEGVDARVAYAEHIQKFAPPLKMSLGRRYAEPEERRPAANVDAIPFEFRVYSDTPLSFHEAVYRDDLLWIARSNDPRSVPLVERHIESLYQRYRSHDSVMTFGRAELRVIAESELVEVADLLKEILQHADWTDTGAVNDFVSQQIAHGVDPNELQTWLTSLDLSAGHLDHNIVKLLLRIDADRFDEVAALVEYSALLREMQASEVGKIRPAAVQWLVEQWKVNPTRELLNLAQVHPNLEPLIEAIEGTDLKTVQEVKRLLQAVWNRESQHSLKATPVVDDAIANACVRSLQASGGDDKAFNSQVAQLLQAVDTQRALEILNDAASRYEDEDGALTKAAETVTSRFAWKVKRYEEDLQLARDLVAGRKSPEDLIDTTDFIWKDGEYEALEESADDSGL